MESVSTKHSSLSDRVFEFVEKAILSASIKPGERLVETKIASDLGVSKSPVRDALNRLEGEGLIRFIPRRGFFVRNIDRKSIDDYFDIMFVLEPTAAILAIRRKSEAVYKKIDEILGNMEQSLREEDYGGYRMLNTQFHGLFYKLTENEWIIRINPMLQKQGFLLRSQSLTKDRFPNSFEEHQAIVDAYKKGDENRLTKAINNHLNRFREHILQADFLNNSAYYVPNVNE